MTELDAIEIKKSLDRNGALLDLIAKKLNLQDDLLSLSEAARYIGKSSTHIQHLAKIYPDIVDKDVKGTKKYIREKLNQFL